MSTKPTVLSLGYTKDLLQEKKSAGDNFGRLKFYAEALDKYLILVLSLQSEKLKPRTIDNMEITPTNGWGYLHALFRMYRLGARYLRHEKVDVIQAQEAYMTGLVGLFLKWRFKKPLNICVYGSNPFDKHWRRESKFNFVVAPIARFVMKRVDGVQVDGTLTKKRLIEAGIKSERIVFKPLIPANLADFSKIDGTSLRRDLLEDGKFEQLLLFIGRMSKQKNVPFLLKAFKKVLHDLPAARLVMIGGGHYKSQYEKLGEELGVGASILWLGAVDYSELMKYYKAADLFALTSFYEGFPRVFMEAASAGLPIVTTMVSGVGDGVIDGENGLVVEQGDLDGWVSGAKKLLENPNIFTAPPKKFPSYDKIQVELWQKLAKM
jgi:1,2-diacylglycerol 3-alpha-glucosyltransferase